MTDAFSTGEVADVELTVQYVEEPKAVCWAKGSHWCTLANSNGDLGNDVPLQLGT